MLRGEDDGMTFHYTTSRGEEGRESCADTGAAAGAVPRFPAVAVPAPELAPSPLPRSFPHHPHPSPHESHSLRRHRDGRAGSAARVPARRRGHAAARRRATRDEPEAPQAARAGGAGPVQPGQRRAAVGGVRCLLLHVRHFGGGAERGGIFARHLRPDARSRADARQAQPGDDVHLRLGNGDGQQRARAGDVGAGEGADGERAARRRFPSRIHVPAGGDRADARDQVADDRVPRRLRPDGARPSHPAPALPERGDDDGAGRAGDARRRRTGEPEACARVGGHQPRGARRQLRRGSRRGRIPRPPGANRGGEHGRTVRRLTCLTVDCFPRPRPLVKQWKPHVAPFQFPLPHMLKSLRYPALAAVLSVTQVACTLDALGAGAKNDSSLPAVSRVVVVSIDGLRADAVQKMPALSALESRAAWTDSMQTVVPSLTVPGHLSMFTGRDVTTMGVTTNTLDQSAGLSLAINGATTMFQWVKDAGGRTSALAATSLIPESSLASAESFFGIDQITSITADLGALRASAIAAATAADAPTLLFVHIPTVDFAGHDFGWVRTDSAAPDGGDVLGVQYLSAARGADSVVDAIWHALQPAIESGDVALVV